MSLKKKPACLQYAGLAGVSQSCLNAVRRFIQFGERVEKATILTAGNEHALLLKLEIVETIAIRTGFTSGYLGEGPRTLAEVLELLSAHGAEIEEIIVTERILRGIDEATLTASELDAVLSKPAVQPSRWYDYIYATKRERTLHSSPWKKFPSVMPWKIIDLRLVDLALSFRESPDHAILAGFRRLEDIVRERTGLDEHGAKLFSQAFHGETSKLHWEKISGSEQSGRAQMFTGAFSAFRNPRAHKEQTGGDDLTEFLSLNQLYRLEALARDRPPATQ